MRGLAGALKSALAAATAATLGESVAGGGLLGPGPGSVFALPPPPPPPPQPASSSADKAAIRKTCFFMRMFPSQPKIGRFIG
jgi:pimeloyl-ACP methyl ester carboxylesterase